MLSLNHAVPGTHDSLFSELLFGSVMYIHARRICVYGESSYSADYLVRLLTVFTDRCGWFSCWAFTPLILKHSCTWSTSMSHNHCNLNRNCNNPDPGGLD